MDTKWKNIDIKRRFLSFLAALWNRKEKWLLLGLAAYGKGYPLISRQFASLYPAGMADLALQMNGVFILGSIGLTKYFLLLKNAGWDLHSGQFLQQWTRRKRWACLLLWLATAVLSILAVLLYHSSTADFSVQHKLLSSNYIKLKAFTIGCTFAGAVIFQWIASYLTIRHEMDRWLLRFSASIEESLARTEASNQQNLEAALRSERLKIDLISNVSHDLKTPLTSMVGYIELIKKEELGDVAADYLEVISKRAQKLKEMIDSLFDLAKTSSGNVKLNFEELEMNRLIEQVMADMAEQVSQSGREIIVSLTPEPTLFTADNLYMYRIIQNLIENALKYSQEHTRIFLKTSVDWQKLGDFQKIDQRKVRFEITNTASYRMDFTKDQIVERFARGETSRTTEGNGLGLAIVNTYTSALGGKFEVSIDCDQFRAILEFKQMQA